QSSSSVCARSPSPPPGIATLPRNLLLPHPRPVRLRAFIVFKNIRLWTRTSLRTERKGATLAEMGRSKSHASNLLTININFLDRSVRSKCKPTRLLLKDYALPERLAEI